MMRATAAIGVPIVCATGFYYFPPWAGLLLLVLAGITYFQPAWGIALLFAVVSADVERPVLGGIVIQLSELLVAAALLAWLAKRRSSEIDWQPLLWGLPFLGAVLLSASVRVEWYKVLPHLVRASELLLCLFLAINVYRSPTSRSAFRWALAAALLFYTIAGFAGFQSPSGPRTFSFFTNPNQFAGYLALLAPFLLAFFLAGPSRWNRFAWGGLTLVAAGALFSTGSRTALLALAAAALWIVIRHLREGSFRSPPGEIQTAGRRMQRTAWMLAPVGLVAAALLLVPSLRGYLLDSARDIMARSEKGPIVGMVEKRLPLNWMGFRVFQDHWLLGIGPGRWEEVSAQYLDRFREYPWGGADRDEIERYVRRYAHVHSHSLYIQLAADYGLLGLGAFLYLLARIAMALRRGSSPWILGGQGLVLAFLIHNVLDVTFPSLAIEMGLLVGAACSATMFERSRVSS